MSTDKFLELNNFSLGLNGFRIELLGLQHTQGLITACQNGELWANRLTSVPHFSEVTQYIQTALKQRQEGSRIPFAVIDEKNNTVVGTTSYHDILRATQRFEIGYTWYAKDYQRTALNTICKFLLLQFAFDQLNVNTIGFRTDQFNFTSQRAIERLGAKKDGVIRGHALRRDGTIRDTVMYSITRGEWDNVKAHLLYLINDKYK